MEGLKYHYRIFNYDLTTARSDEELQIEGGFIYIKDASDLTVSISIKTDSVVNDAVVLKKQYGIIIPPKFKKIYISHVSQVGKNIEIIITDSYETFRIFEQVQNQDIGSVTVVDTVTRITNPISQNGYRSNTCITTDYTLLASLTWEAGTNIVNAEKIEIQSRGYNPVYIGIGAAVTSVVLPNIYDSYYLDGINYTGTLYYYGTINDLIRINYWKTI